MLGKTTTEGSRFKPTTSRHAFINCLLKVTLWIKKTSKKVLEHILYAIKHMSQSCVRHQLCKPTSTHLSWYKNQSINPNYHAEHAHCGFHHSEIWNFSGRSLRVDRGAFLFTHSVTLHTYVRGFSLKSG